MIETKIKTIDELIAYLQSIKELDSINGEAKLYIEAHEEASGIQIDGIVASYNPTTHTIEFEPNMAYDGQEDMMIHGAVNWRSGGLRVSDGITFYVTYRDGTKKVITKKDKEYNDVHYLLDAPDDKDFAKKLGIKIIQRRVGIGFWECYDF